MNAIPIPEDLRQAPFEVLRDFIEIYNKALVAGNADPMTVARSKLAKKYGQQATNWKGQEVVMGHDYSDVNGPPLHPNCRCVLVAELDEEKMVLVKGGPGSGNFGHEGRPGEVGGSASSVVLHGTSSKNLVSIMKNGLQPQTGKKRVWRQLSTGGERTGSVFVLDTKLKDIPENAKDLYDVSNFSDATSAAQSYARDAAVGKQHGVIIVARIPKSELKPDTIGSRTSLEGGKAAKMVLGGIAPENILGYVELPDHWQDRAPRFRRKKGLDEETIVFIPVAVLDNADEEIEGEFV